MSDEQQPLEWGLVPLPIVQVVRILAAKVDRQTRHLTALVWPEKPRDVQDLLRLSIGDSHKIARAGTDIRSLLTAYAHQFHEPKPVMAELARAQDTSRQGIPRRYGEPVVDAIRELLSESPNTGVILHALPSLALKDLEGIDGPVGRVAARQLTGEKEFISFTTQQRDREHQGHEKATNRISELLSPLTPRDHEEGARMPVKPGTLLRGSAAAEAAQRDLLDATDEGTIDRDRIVNLIEGTNND